MVRRAKDPLHKLELRMHKLCQFNEYEDTWMEGDYENPTDWMEIENSFELEPIYRNYVVQLPQQSSPIVMFLSEFYYKVQIFAGSIDVCQIRLNENCHREIWEGPESEKTCQYCRQLKCEPPKALLEAWERGDVDEWPEYKYMRQIPVFDYTVDTDEEKN